MEIHLIGRPQVIAEDPEAYRPRSRKTWAILCYLLLSERPPSRTRLASLLFADADDPLRALRWNLSELRRVLGPLAEVGGDPVELSLPSDVTVDIELVSGGSWKDIIELPTVGEELLAGLDDIGSPEFESWLLAERRRAAGAIEDALHEAALALLARGDVGEAVRVAVELVGMNPYRESHHAVLIRAYRVSGDTEAAERQYEACIDLFVRELGVMPGPAVRAAMLVTDVSPAPVGGAAAYRAALEAGRAALSAGSPDAAQVSLRSAVVMADSLGAQGRRLEARLALADAVFRSNQGDDEEGAMILHEVVEMARETGHDDFLAQAMVELGYLDMLAARYDRSEHWLAPEALPTDDPVTLARAYSYLGCLWSDRAEYDKAGELLESAVAEARIAGIIPLEAYATSLIGRMHFLLGDLDAATRLLTDSIETHDWFAFVPWPESFLGEVALERGDLEKAREHLEQAFARACQLGDPCWEGVSGRGLALLAEARGETDQAFALLEDAAIRCDRRSDTYVWAKAYILDAQCSLGRIHSHEGTVGWTGDLYDLVARTGMRELRVRAMLHRSALGLEDEHGAALLLAEEIGNPRLMAAVAAA